MKRRRLWIALAGLCLFVLAAVLTLQSAWFRGQIRGLIVDSIQAFTGGRVEMGSLDWDWSALRIRVAPFVLHGTEAPDQSPLFRCSSLEIKLTLLSLWNRRLRLDRLTIDTPEIHIYVDPQGRTNLPFPASPPSGRNAVQELLRLAIHRLEVKNGSFQYNRYQIPLQIIAGDLTTSLDWNARGPRYLGRISARSIAINETLTFGLDLPVVLEGDRISFQKAQLVFGASTLTFSGQVQNWTEPRLESAFEGDLVLADVPRLGVSSGRATLTGKAEWSSAGYLLTGSAAGRDLVLPIPDFKITSIRARTSFRVDPRRVELSALEVRLLDGVWKGRASIDDGSRFRFEGAAEDFTVERLQQLRDASPVAWNGVLAGPVSIEGVLTADGVRDTRLDARLDVQPSAGALPIRGELAVAYSQKDAVFELGDSYLTTPSATARFRGALGRTLDVRLAVTRTEDLEPIIDLFRPGQSTKIPLRLADGLARFEGTVAGPLDSPIVQGRIALRNAVVDGNRIDRFEARVTVARDRFDLTQIRASRDAGRAAGEFHESLTDWAYPPSSPLSARFRLEQADLAEIVPNLKGKFGGTISFSGSFAEPQAEFDLEASSVEYAGERFRTAKLHLTYADMPDDLIRGSLRLDEAVVDIEGSYRHQPGRLEDGDAEIRLTARNWSFGSIERVQRASPGLQGAAEIKVAVRLAVAAGRPSLRALEGTLAAPKLALPSGPVGSLEANAWTEGGLLRVQSRLDLRGRPVQSTLQVKLDGDYAAIGKVIIPPLPFRTIRDIAVAAPSAAPPPFQGVVEGEINWQGPLAAPERITGRAVLNRLLVRPREANVGELALDVTDLTLRNNGPLAFDLDSKGIHVRTARFSARETDLSLSGSFSFDERIPWNLSAEGSVNLAVLSTFKPDLQASGSSTLKATLRGRLDQPQLNGRMEIRRASFFLKDVPNGIEQAYGTILFDRNRANIERLTGQTGGGSFDLSGFIGFAGDEFTYRLQSNLNGIRVRYPEGVSTTLSANLSLTGTSVRSLIAGNITVLRSGFNPRSDLATLVEQSSLKGSGIAVQNEFVQGVQFDIRIRTAPNAEIQTSYTRDVQTEADLRLRGSIAKPILLGRVKVNQGEIDFLGTRYNISRGEIIFYNTTTLQPAVDLDLETRVRGVTVLVNFAGPINKLNVSYRSDPPLQSSEILALLAVGRTPDSSRTSLGPSQNVIGQNTMPGGGALLGGALSASVNGRLERFFGASRIKIDPTITGVENIPQARLTVEQQVSRDITVTFVTNLNRAQQQIWRIEWDLNREWSVIAVRDENGLFGVDFLLRKRFK